MRQLSKLQTAIFAVGAVLMVVGAVATLFWPRVAPFIFAPGAMAYVSMQMLQSYDGRNFVIRRLRRIMLVSDVLLLLTAVLMFAGNGNPLGMDWMSYLFMVRNNWVVVLLIAAVLQLYTTFRISAELEKEAKKC